MKHLKTVREEYHKGPMKRNFYKESSVKNTNVDFLHSVVSSLFDFFSFLTKHDKKRLLREISQKIAFYVSDKKTYREKKFTKFEKQSVLQELFMTHSQEYSESMIHVIANFFDINICIAEDRAGAFAYTIYPPTQNHHLKGSIIIKKHHNMFCTLQLTPTESSVNGLVNQYEFEDILKYFYLFQKKKNNSLLPYYKYKIKELQDLAKKFNMNITKRGRGMQRINKSKKELYDELYSILQ